MSLSRLIPCLTGRRSSKPPKTTPTRLGLELLEKREVLAVNLNLAANGVLSIVGDGAIALAEMAQLHFIAAQVAGEFMDKDQGRAGSGFLEIEANPVVCLGIWHVVLP